MADRIKEGLIKIVKSRLFIFGLVMLFLFLYVIHHLFSMQIINGKEYQDNYTLSIEKEITTEGTRGNIYDRNGLLLAHNELSYTITIEDNGTYDSTEERAEMLNGEIDTLIDMLEENGDTISNDFNLHMDPDGTLSFLVSDAQLMRFRADVYGHADIDDLVVNAKLGYNEATASPEQIFTYLLDKFGIDQETYGRYRAYQIMIVRNRLFQNSFQRYIAADVAEDVSDETVAMIREHAYELQGVEVQEDTKRVYDYPEYFSHIIGYTGNIDAEEYETLSGQDDSYSLNDVIGKAGIEQYMELELHGKKGSRTVYVNNLGKVLEVKKSIEPSAGNDVYLSIDANLQMAVYEMLEQELAGILYSQILDEKTTEQPGVEIPIYNVYNTLIENSIIDTGAMADAQPGTVQAAVRESYAGRQAQILSEVEAVLAGDGIYSELSEEMQDYITYVITMLQEQGVFDADRVDASDEVYLAWKDGTVSVREYLKHAIDLSWIDVSFLDLNDKYEDTDEVYLALIPYIMETLKSDKAFDKIIYKYLIMDDKITGTQLCLILFEQGVLAEDEEAVAGLKNGQTSAYDFLKSKIRSLELTPAQLALDPCTGSCVIMDPNTGELLACVTYPGYDTNRLANTMDSEYYNSLLKDKSLPFYNNATQQTTAPGSTFKMVTTAAGLTEGVITQDTIIEDEGTFTKLGLDLDCWIYPSNHGKINILEAIRESCNYFFCEVGYRLSTTPEEVYDEDKGLETLGKYAEQFGLGDNTGIEIPEGNSKIATEYPVSASIGQSNNNFTTSQLCRYVAAIANEGTVYDLTLLDRVTDASGNVIREYQPQIHNQITNLSASTWDIMHQGMRLVVENHSVFDDLTVQLAGKTGTAQENKKRPNHALFVGYAPYESPQMAVATRIAYGYGSSNACDFVDKVIKYYFKQLSADELINGQAADVGTSSNAVTD